MEPWRCSLKTKFNEESLVSQDLIASVIEIMKWWYGIINIFIATYRGWRHTSRMVDKTARLQGERDHSPQDLVEGWAIVVFYVFDHIFVTRFLRQWLTIPCWKARATWALVSCGHDTDPQAAPFLSRETSRGQLALPTHLPLLLYCSSACDSSSWHQLC